MYVWILNPTVLELDFWANKLFVLPQQDSNAHIWYTTAHIAVVAVMYPIPYIKTAWMSTLSTR